MVNENFEPIKVKAHSDKLSLATTVFKLFEVCEKQSPGYFNDVFGISAVPLTKEALLDVVFTRANAQNFDAVGSESWIALPIQIDGEAVDRDNFQLSNLYCKSAFLQHMLLAPNRGLYGWRYELIDYPEVYMDFSSLESANHGLFAGQLFNTLIRSGIVTESRDEYFKLQAKPRGAAFKGVSVVTYQIWNLVCLGGNNYECFEMLVAISSDGSMAYVNNGVYCLHTLPMSEFCHYRPCHEPEIDPLVLDWDDFER